MVAYTVHSGGALMTRAVPLSQFGEARSAYRPVRSSDRRCYPRLVSEVSVALIS